MISRPSEIGHQRRGLGADDRFAQRIAVHQPGDGEQQQGACRALIDWRRITSAPISRVVSPTNSSLAGRSTLGKMQADAGDDGDAEGQHDGGAAAGQGGEDADADDGGKMIDADHRMTEARQQALQEGLRQLAVHDVMRPSRLDGHRHDGREHAKPSQMNTPSLPSVVAGRPDGRPEWMPSPTEHLHPASDRTESVASTFAVPRATARMRR